MKINNIIFSVLFCVLSVFINNIQCQDENCECSVYYLCAQADTVSTSTKCGTGAEVCCRVGPTSNPVVTAPIRATTPSELRNPVGDNRESSDCNCVAPDQCPQLSGANQLDIRFKRCEINQVCCPVEGSTGGGNIGGGTGGGDPIGGGQGGGDIGGGQGGYNFDDFQECGVRRSINNQLTNKISGRPDETETFFAEYPWMMAILANRQNKDGSITENVFQCGATLILPNVVMTAAHCVNKFNVNDIKVRGGEWDTISNNKTDREPFQYQERTVSKVLVHDKFVQSTVYNDIALLMLDFPFEIKNHIGQICTPNSAQEYDPNSCLVTGWGKDKFGVGGKYQSTLRKIDLKIVPRDTCVRKLRQTRLGQDFQLHESFLCASGEPNQDACKGDGGGPLICKLKNEAMRYTQVGIVAWGIGCGSDTPGVYVDVHKFKKWILDNSHDRTIDTRIKTKN